MSQNSEFDVRDAAEMWVLRIERDYDEECRLKFDAWLRESPEHMRAYLQADAHWAELKDLFRPEPPGQRAPSFSGIWHRCLAFFKAAAVMAAVLPLFGVTAWLVNRNAGLTFVTKTGETRLVKLPEGSTAHLNTRTHLRWTGNKQNRRVELLQGEVLLTVEHDEHRPFRVILDDSEIRVLGTEFDVYRKPRGSTVVTVLEGKVDVLGRGGEGWLRTLNAHEQLEYQSTGVPREPIAAPEKKFDWTADRLTFDNVPLKDVVDELSRYLDKPVVAEPRAVRQLVMMKLGIKGIRLKVVEGLRGAGFTVTETENAITVGPRLADGRRVETL